MGGRVDVNIQIVSQRVRHKEIKYYLDFDWIGRSDGGFSFRCDSDGVVDVEKLNRGSLESWNKCHDGTYKVGPPHISKVVHEWVEPAVGECVCGAKVQLEGFTNTCEQCGRDYNNSGSLLAPRSQWGIETGESLGDILRIP